MSAAANLVRLLDEKGRMRALTPGEWFAHDDVPSHDFNREMVPAGMNSNAPNGAIVIRADDDFWIVAALPPEFAETPLPYLVGYLWPEIENPTFGPDVQQDVRS